MSIIFGKIGILFLILSIVITNNIVNTKKINNEPIIGILSQETKRYNHLKKGDSLIAASYVKFIEGAGARVVPIKIGKNESYYETLLENINGVLWPGGAANFNNNNGYADAGYTIYKIAKNMNKNGYHFPILGICLGFELLIYVANKRSDIRIKCSSQSQSLSLKFHNDLGNSLPQIPNRAYVPVPEQDPSIYNPRIFPFIPLVSKQSSLFHNVSSEIEHILRNKKVTINFHNYCITKNELAKAHLDKTFRVISENKDKNGIEFISSLEDKKYPFYGLQFHPEKNIYEWIENKNIPHTSEAIEVGQYFANFFVNEARKNNHTFSNNKKRNQKLIYNYNPIYTGNNNNSSFEQIYLFD